MNLQQLANNIAQKKNIGGNFDSAVGILARVLINETGKPVLDADNLGILPMWQLITIQQAQLAASGTGTTGTIGVTTLPANSVIHAAFVRTGTGVVGTGITAATFSLAAGSSNVVIESNLNVFGTSTASVFNGTQLMPGAPYALVPVTGTLTTTGGNVPAITGGAIQIDLLVSQAP